MKLTIITASILGVAVISMVAIFLQTKQQEDIAQSNPNVLMAGAPCHQMGGAWMGDCEFDENGNPTNQ